MRNKCASLKREAKTMYYQSCTPSSKGESSKLWKHIKDLAPNSLKQAPAYWRRWYHHNKYMCETFNHYFSNVVNQYLLKSNQAPDFRKLLKIPYY